MEKHQRWKIDCMLFDVEITKISPFIRKCSGAAVVFRICNLRFGCTLPAEREYIVVDKMEEIRDIEGDDERQDKRTLLHSTLLAAHWDEWEPTQTTPQQ